MSKPKPKVKKIKAWAVVSFGLIVPSVKMRLFAIRLDVEDFAKKNWGYEENVEIVQVLISPLPAKKKGKK